VAIDDDPRANKGLESPIWVTSDSRTKRWSVKVTMRNLTDELASDTPREA
jgi:hypothetical protein